MNLFNITKERKKELKGLDSSVLFEIDLADKNDPYEYRLLILKMISEFIIWAWNKQADKDSGKRKAHAFLRKLHSWNGDEGGISEYICGKFVTAKMYLYSGELKGNYGYNSELLKGVVFRDHYGDYSLVKIHFLSDAFEEFLKENKIKYKRTNRKRNN